MVFSKYKEMIDLMTIYNTTEKQIDDLIEKMAEDEDLTTDEYTKLYSMAIDIMRY